MLAMALGKLLNKMHMIILEHRNRDLTKLPPIFTSAALCTFGIQPLHRPFTPDSANSNRNACEQLLILWKN